jgi:hypothetical protein
MNLDGRTNDLLRLSFSHISVPSVFSVAMLLSLRSDAYADSIVQIHWWGSLRSTHPTVLVRRLKK